jgi:AraC family transcriptional regulator
MQSRDIGSDILRVEHHHQPANGTSECCLSNYLLSIHLGQPIQLKRTVDGRRSSDYLTEGDIMISPPYLHRKLSWDVDAEFLLLRLEPKLFTSAVSETLDTAPIQITPQLKIRDPLIQQIGLALKTELEIDGLSNRLYAESIASALAVHLLHRYSTHKPVVRTYSGGLSSLKLQQAIDYIQTHLAEDISLETIATEVGMSRYYFCRLFKQSTGISPYQYLLECRIERAKVLLLQGQQSIIDIAIQAGFTNQSQFGKHFKRFTGVTPKQFWQRSQ